MINTAIIRFKDITDNKGCLTPIEGSQDVPFEIKRVYCITQVQSGVVRGFHAHKVLHQVLVCLNGTVKIRIKTPFEEEIITLDSSNKGLYIGTMVWREMFDFSQNAVLMVLASKHYDESDYIRTYSEYEKEARKIFAGEVCK